MRFLDMRYMKQRDNYSCGPVALANVMKWAGSKKSAGSLRKYFMPICKCSPENGTRPWEIHNALLTIDDISFEKVEYPGLQDLDGHLDDGGIVLLRVRYEDGGHYFICTRRTQKMYEVINRKVDHVTKSLVSRKTMSKDISYADVFIGGAYYAVAWLIKKEKS